MQWIKCFKRYTYQNEYHKVRGEKVHQLKIRNLNGYFFLSCFWYLDYSIAWAVFNLVYLGQIIPIVEDIYAAFTINQQASHWLSVYEHGLHYWSFCLGRFLQNVLFHHRDSMSHYLYPFVQMPLWYYFHSWKGIHTKHGHGSQHKKTREIHCYSTLLLRIKPLLLLWILPDMWQDNALEKFVKWNMWGAISKNFT